MKGFKLLFAVLIAIVSCISVRSNAELKVGSAKMDITPDLPCYLGGYYMAGQAESAHDPLYARAIVISDGQNTVALVETDLIMMNGYLSSEIKQEIESKLSIPSGNVTITSIHTHTGPEGFYEEYGKYPKIVDMNMKKKIEQGIFNAINEAQKKMAPAEVGTAYIDLTGLTHNRHSDEYPVDSRGFLLLARNKDGKLIAGLLNFASHAILAPAQALMISADWPGVFTATLDKKMNGGVFLFLQGAEGDITPAGAKGEGWDKVNDYGMQMASAVASHFSEVKFTSDFPVGGKAVELTLPVRKQKISAEFRNAIPAKIEAIQKSDLPKQKKDKKIAWLRERAGLESFLQPMFKTMKRVKNGETKTYAQALKLGDSYVVTFPGEPTAELGMKIRSELAPAKVAVLGLTNDHLAYMTSQTMFEEGGYEAGMSLIYPDSVDKIIETDLALVKELGQGK